MKILVTGGAGFIGSAVIRFLIEQTDEQVINVDKLTYAGNLGNVATVSDSERYTFEKIDICNSGAITAALVKHQPDVIMNLAAESHVDRSIDGPVAFINTNIIGTYTLLEATRRYWDSLPEHRKCQFRFHQISTDEVFGELPLPGTASAEESVPFTERSPYAPNSPYAATKASADHLVRAWHRTFGLPILITNCSNNFGPYQFPEKLIPLVILNALEQKPLPVYGRGEQIRDWLYVDDHAEALYEVIKKGKVGETYNIGGQAERRNIDVVCAISDTLDELKPGKTPHRNLITYVNDRPGHDQRYAIDITKIQNDIGWTPKESFETGLKKTISWYLDNLNWCARVQNESYQRERLGDFS